MSNHHASLIGQVWMLGRPALFLTEVPPPAFPSDGGPQPIHDKKKYPLMPMAWVNGEKKPGNDYRSLPSGTEVELIEMSVPTQSATGGPNLITGATFLVRGPIDAHMALFMAQLYVQPDAISLADTQDTVLKDAKLLPDAQPSWSAKRFEEIQKELGFDLGRVVKKPAR